MATYTDNGTNTPNGSHKVFTYTFPVLQTEDIKVALNGVAQATTKYTASLSPAQIEFNNTSIDSSVQESTGAPKTGVQVRVFRETTVGKNSGDEDPKAVFAAGSSIRAADLNANQEQALFAIHELQTQPVKTSDIEPDAVTNAKIVDNAIDSEHYVDGSIDRVHLEADIIDGSKIEDNAVNNEHIAADAVRTSEIQNSAVTQNKLANNSVGTPELINGSVNSDKIANGTIVNADISSSAAIDASKIVSATGSVAGTMSASDKAKLDGIESGAKDDQTAAEIKTLLQSNKITDSEIATGTLDNRYFTETELTGGALDGRYFTETESDARYFNVSTGDTIKDGDTFPDNDTTIATTAAINDRIIDLVDDVGGFVPIANETSFPNANPDVNNGTGTIVSISTLASNHTSSGSGVITISNGTVGNSTVTINGAANSTTYSAGYGLLVETTTTLNTYTFHRLVPKATEVTTVAGKATEIGRLGTADAVADMAILGTADVVADLNTLGTADVVSDMNALAVSDVISDMNTLAVTDVINDMDTVATNVTNVNNVGGSIANVNTTAGSIANVNTVAGSIANVNTTAGSISNVNTTAGSISNVNSVATNMANVNNFADRYQIASNNPSTDGGGNALAAGDLYFNTSANELKVYNGSSWQAGVTATGNFASTTGNTFTGDNRYNDGVKALFGTGSDLEIYHNGSHSLIADFTGDGNIYLITNEVTIKNAGSTEHMARFISNGAVELYYDNSKKIQTTSGGVYVTGDIDAGDNGKIKLGGGDDLKIFHDGGNSYIQDTGTGSLRVTGDSIILLDNTNSEKFIEATANGSVDLYYDSSKKFETTTNGAKISGTAAAFLEISTTSGAHNPMFRGSNGDRTFDTGLRGDFSDSWCVYDVTAADLRLEVTTNGDVNIPNDSKKLQLGAGQDLQIYHNGTDSYLQNNTGNLFIRGNGDDIFLKAVNTEDSLICRPNGAVELYYDNSKKFFTISNGVQATNRIIVGEGTNQRGLISGDQNGVSAGSMSNIPFTLVQNSLAKCRVDGNDFQILNDNGKLQLGAGQDLQIYHTGTLSRIDNNTGDLLIRTNVASDVGGNIYLKPHDNEDGIKIIHDAGVELYYDGSKKFETMTSGAVISGNLNINGVVNANIRMQSGPNTVYAGIDFYNNAGSAANSINSYAASILFITGRNATVFSDVSAEICEIVSGGIHPRTASTVCSLGTSSKKWTNVYADTLYGDGSNLTGINTDLVSDTSPQLGGNLDTNSFEIMLDDDHKVNFGNSNDLEIWHSSNNNSYIKNSTGELKLASDNIALMTTDQSEKFIDCNGNGNVELYYDNSKKLETESSGARTYGDHNVTGEIHLTTDNQSLKIGAGADLRIKHDGTHNYVNFVNGALIFQNNGTGVAYFHDSDGHFLPWTNNTFDLGSSGNRWRNIYTNDLHLSNEGSSNDVDSTWGDWTIQEGESDLFLKNNRSGKKYKFNLTEVS